MGHLLSLPINSHIILNKEINVKGRENERTGSEEEVDTLDFVDETEDVEVVLELNLEVVDAVGDRILERIPGIKPVVVDVAGVFLSLSLSLSFAADCVGVGGVEVVSKKLKRPNN